MVTHDNGLAARLPRVVEVVDGQLFEGARNGQVKHA
jgi:predicted ABC-type transport system involved in lysophospholipase L1 biosynthesis ATPase subunit